MLYDIAIIGGGPAGMSAAIYALRAGKSAILFEGKALGGTLHQISALENYPGFMGSGAELAEVMENQIKTLGCEIKGKFVLNVIKLGKEFMITAGSEDYRAKKVIYCGGFSRNTLDFAKKFEGKGVSYCATCDGMFFRNRTVALVGNGYDAEEEAKFLGGLCKKVHLISSETIKVNGENFEVHTPYNLVGMNGSEFVESIKIHNLSDKTEQTIQVDGVFLAMGASSKTVLTDLKAEGQIDAEGEQTKVEGLFVAGDINKNCTKQVVTACASGANAALAAIRQLNAEKK